jgi:hypothetical protein
MRVFLAVCAAFAFFALLTVGPSADPAAGIPGLKPATVSLHDVIAKYNAALKSEQVETGYELWHVSSGGLAGTEEDIYDRSDYRDTRVLGPFQTAEGRLGKQSWVQNENGYTVLMHGAHHMDATSSDALQDAINGKETDYVKLLGEISAPKPAYVVEVAPPGGRHEWLYIDATSGALVRKDRLVEGLHYVTTYGDFRTTNGVVRPWHIHSSDGRPGNDYDAQMTTFTPNTPPDRNLFAIPTDRRNVVEFPPGVSAVRLPARIIDGSIVVTATIDGRGLDFALDSGSSSVVLDSSVARQLGLPTFGAMTGSTVGTYTEHLSVVRRSTSDLLRCTISSSTACRSTISSRKTRRSWDSWASISLRIASFM